MSEKYGQAIGGIKSQQKLLRDRVQQFETQIQGLERQITSLRLTQRALCWSLWIFYGTVIIAFLARHYGWW